MAQPAAPRMPAYFLAHGGGPKPLLGDPAHKGLIEHLKHLPATLPRQPEAVLVVSAHFVEPRPTVTSGSAPPLLFDYDNFPPEAYQYTYPAPGKPELARHVVDLLRRAGIEAAEDSTRGFDHGVFVPLKLAFPDAEVPVVDVSILSSFDPQAHIAVGEALAPLRDEGVLIIGSGLSYHNLPAFEHMKGAKVRLGGATDSPAAGDDAAVRRSAAFDEALVQKLTNPAHTADQRREALTRWAELPEARFAHPHEDHLLPLHVVLGTASCGVGQAYYRGTLYGTSFTSFRFD